MTIFWAGDSTVRDNDRSTWPQAGLGQGFRPLLRSGVILDNRAENGRSTKSFLAEGRLEAIREEIAEGDFLFIQFGHNDEKREDPSRFTEPRGEFQTNLALFVAAAREKGARPVLITPLCRRHFGPGGKLLQDIHGDYPAAMRELADRMAVPCPDLYRASRERIQEEGPEGSRRFFMNLEPGEYPLYPRGLEDNTHLRLEGAAVFAELLARELAALGGAFREILKDPAF